MYRCAAHPDVETGLTCSACGTPICPDCMVETPVGMKCRSCGTAPLPAVYRVGPAGLVIAIAVGVALGALAGGVVLLWRLGFFTLFLGPLVGSVIGEAASRAAGWKRGRTIATAASISCGVGMVLGSPTVAATLSGGGISPLPVSLAVLALRPFFLLFVGLAIAAAFWRTR